MTNEQLSILYWAIGFLVISNLGTIGAVLRYGAKFVYRFAILVSTLKALHRRVDRLDGMGGPEDDDGY